MTRLEHLQMRRLRLVPAGDQPVDDAQPTIRGDHQPGPAGAGAGRIVAARDGLQRAHNSRTDGDDPTPPAPYCAHQSRGRLWHLVVLRERSLVALGEDTPVCSVIGATSTPRAVSRVISSRVNGRPALGISALPGVVA